MRTLWLFPLVVALCHSHVIREDERDLEWWETSILYQIYPRSFADSDGDGIGDLKGITSKLGYVKEIGVGAIWLSPIFQSPMYDFGYDISDFYAIHDEFGTMEDFEELMAKANELDIKIVLDLVPNHGSNESVWFQEALNGNEKYYNYFVWEDGIIDEEGNRQPPNNWLSHFRGSAWEWRDEVGKYYLHQFAVGQPDFNYRNPEVAEEIKNVIRFWLEKGVAGFRVDAVNCLFEVDKELYGGKYPDEPRSGDIDADPDSHNYLNHIYTKDRNETYYMVYDWRDVLEEFAAKDGMPRVMMTEVYATVQNVMRYFGEGDRIGAQMPFNFALIEDINGDFSAPDLKRSIEKFLTYKPIDKNANWVVGNHDNSRMATKFGPTRVDAMNMVVLLLPGVGVSYMGEELGMEDGYVSWEDTVDPSGCNTNDPINYYKESRDPERTPFHWNAEKNAGFSTADKTWLPMADNYELVNVEVQKAAARSHLKVYQALAELRQEKTFKYGRYESLAFNEDVLVFRRWYKGETYLVVINLHDKDHILDLTYLENVSGDASVVITSVESPKQEGDIVNVSALPVAPNESIVLRLATILLLKALVIFGHATADRELDWWETTIFYQIYPRSFMDSDGDGIGDIKGITSQLEYLKELGVGATWLSPIFKSPMYDFGYDISDFYDIQEEYGTMEDFENLIAKANELDIKIILDFVPNHGSNESYWFDEALKGHEKYLDYFVWEDGIEDENGNLHPPSNWLSVFRDSAWEYRPEVGKYYLHQFVVGQPDFNYRNPDVVEEMKNILRFWLDKGVAGFRVDACAHLFEAEKIDGKVPDEPISGNRLDDPNHYDYLDHIYTKDLDETYEQIYLWREVLEEYKAKDGMSRVMMTEVYTNPQNTMRYFGDGVRDGAQMPFNFVLISDVNGESTAAEMKYAIDKFLTFKPIDKLANWVAGNHDNNRVASRFSPESVDAINMIVLLLPGIAVTYMGEEIGMVDGWISWEDTVDPSACNTGDPLKYEESSRDPERTPFQWNSEMNAGFSTSDKTWLPVADGYETLNVEVQRNVEKSHLNVYKFLSQLRTEVTFRQGRYESVAFNSDVFAFRRWHQDEMYVVVMNFRDVAHTIDLTYFENVVGQLEVLVSSVNSPKNAGDLVEASSLNVEQYEAVVLKLIQ
ncbi:uncharacterized protein LOC121729416 [Aricia agestis]|uniref:uncharacterized protein LOC121729416 n=1 Tax=Aricia agestis TaxID=91739 RepID=UPI001C20A7D6|nr:uncharacterized protein LOC121729416 [Aricia agestis]